LDLVHGPEFVFGEKTRIYGDKEKRQPALEQVCRAVKECSGQKGLNAGFKGERSDGNGFLLKCSKPCFRPHPAENDAVLGDAGTAGKPPESF
jgi:hypothetical protein